MSLSNSERKELEGHRTSNRIMNGVIFSGIWYMMFWQLVLWLLGNPVLENPRWDIFSFLPIMIIGGLVGWKYPQIKKKLKGE